MRHRILGALRAASGGGPDDLHPRTLELARAALAVDAGSGGTCSVIRDGCASRPSTRSTWGSRAGCPSCRASARASRVEEDARDLYRRAAERLLEHLPAGDRLHSRAVATLLGHADNRVQRFVDLVIEMLARRESWGPKLPGITDDEVSNAEIRSQLEAASTELVAAHLASVLRAFPRDLLAEAAAVAREAAIALAAAGAESPLAVWQGHASLPGAEPGDAPLWLGLATLLLTETGAPRKRFDSKLGMPPGAQGKPLKARAEAARLGSVATRRVVRTTARGTQAARQSLHASRVAGAAGPARGAAARGGGTRARVRRAPCGRLPALRRGGAAGARGRGRAHRYSAGARRNAAARARRRVPGHVGDPGPAAGEADHGLAT